MTALRSRITGTGEVDPTDLLANPKNWRIHPREQRGALNDVLEQLGWIQQVIVNTRTGHLVDGHLRVDLAVEREEPTIPVLYVDLTEDEEALVLATLDPMAGMAVPDTEQLSALLAEVQADGSDLQRMLDNLPAIADPLAGTPAPTDPRTVTCPECQHEFTP